MDLKADRDLPRAAGLTGVLISPEGAAPEGGVVLIGGSEGGLHERDAAVLAGEGFAVLALAYFGAPGVPPVLKNIPLEYFSRGVQLLLDGGVRRVGILGGSRGGEAALLVASHDRRIAAAVSVVGSGVVTQGIDYGLGPVDVIMATPTVAWTLGGAPLPALPNQVSAEFAAAVAAGGPVGLATQYGPLPTEPAALAEISIPVEQSDAAILLIAGERDAMWDSASYHAVAAARLEAARHPRPWHHVVLPGAGHGIAGPPGEPITSTVSPGPGVSFELGGDPAATTAARAEAWHRTVRFLREHLT
ncbi:acyl-CoA thioester hydrolase/BAAT C-terminal domain-containing protein [Microlunatus parietis]|uniref:Dienelactone hydrolase n=1 Tax=Microlunatus parietis TaxID=682979 RepID=A0A7Y9I3E0_9ACTN|nr:acyl-CoA thioester hydrolase/BAAT C-terminal domain-containing protein [Microlunatus parietis]NYE69310.1 dienelactone hydrolase [Microlunatus parietis]